MDKVVQQNAANAEESARAAEETNSQANYLKDVVEDLTGLVGGESAGTITKAISWSPARISEKYMQ
jgi:methyl-accepting chemotaxis protein